MSDIDEIVSVTISQTTASVSQAGFGVPMIIGSTTPIGGAWSERYREYTSMAGVAEDFLSSDAEYLAANAIFSQDPCPSTIMIASRTANVQAVKTITFAGDLVASNTTAFTVNGTVVSVLFSVDQQTTAGLIATAIAAIDGVASAVVSGTPYRVITVTASAGRTLTISAVGITGGAGQTTAAVATSTAGTTMSDNLDAITLETDDYYAICLTSTLEADQLITAGWVESRTKIAIFRSTDADILDPNDTDDIAYRLDALGYKRSAVIYTEDADEYADAAWLGVCLPYDPGSETWKFKTLTGVTASALTATETSAAQAKHCNLYRTIGGVDITSEGYAASGRFIDQTRGIDWLHARLQERIFSRLANSAKIPFTDAGVAVIEGEVRAQLADGIAVGLLADDPAPTVTVPAVADVSTANRALRTLPDVNFTAQLAGAVHTIEIAGVVSV
jgi:hypothetical protein